MASLDKFARRLDRIEGDLRDVATKPRLARSSVDGGAIELRDLHGDTVGFVGEQFDGTVTMAAVGGLTPPSPLMPLIEAVSGGLRIYWDGTFASGETTPMNFRRVTFHAVTDVALFDALDPAQICGEITIATGGEIFAALPPVEHFIFAVSWSDAGKFSVESDPAFGTPLSLVDDVAWQDHEAALTNLNQVQLPGLNERLDNWTTPGKTTIDGGQITTDSVTALQIAANTITANEVAADTITGNEIKADTIDTIHLRAGSVNAEILRADVMQAGFTLTGRLQVGSAYWTPAEGIVIPAADGTYTRFPADGVTPSTVSGRLNAKSLTIEGDMSLNGTTNQVQGSLKLANGITRPTVAPAVYQSWDTRYAALLDNGDTPWQVQQGLCERHGSTTDYAFAQNFGGAAIRFFNKNTGDGAGDLPDPDGWGANFVPYGGVAYASGSYYVFGQDSDRSAGWYAYRLDATTGAKQAEIYTGPNDTFGSGVRISANAANGRVYLASCHQTSGVASLRHWDLALTYVGDQEFNGFGSGVYRSFTGLYVGPADVGEQRIWVVSKEDRKVLCFRLSDNGYFADQSFPVAGSATPFGLTWDSNLSQFTSFDSSGQLHRYSGHATSKSVSATYTWYDGDGTTRETEPSPVATFTLPPRAFINVETSTPPDSGVTDPSRVDKANRVGIYVGLDGATRRRQSYLGVDGSGVSIRKLTINAVDTGLNTEPTTNGFTGGQTSPGQIVSAATDTNGIPLLSLDGSGALRAKTINGQTFEDTGWITPTLTGSPSVWQNFGSGFQGARYRRLNGIVYIQGLIRLGTMGTAAFSLPAGFRPLGGLMFASVDGANGIGRLDITSDGAVVPSTGNANFFTISVSFPAEQ